MKCVVGVKTATNKVFYYAVSNAYMVRRGKDKGHQATCPFFFAYSGAH